MLMPWINEVSCSLSCSITIIQAENIGSNAFHSRSHDYPYMYFVSAHMARKSFNRYVTHEGLTFFSLRHH